MLDSLKIHQKMMAELRKVKVNDFNDLKDLLKEKQDAEKQNLKLENDLEAAELQKQTELNALRKDNENEILSLKHALKLELEKQAEEMNKQNRENQHKYDIAKKEWDKERETLRLTVQQEIAAERKAFLEQNFGDLQEKADKVQSSTMEMLGIFLDKINYDRKALTGGENTEIKDVDVTIKDK